VVAAGIAMVAATFGLARYGYGLLLPDIRRSLGLSSTSLGPWSARVFASRPATGLAAVLFMLGLGQIVGPVLAGMLADGVGRAAAFLAGGALIFACALLPPREELRAAVASSG
jgi:MFS family permease